jgi:hypothetical protein
MVGVEADLAQFYVSVSKDSGNPHKGNDDGWAAHVERFTIGVASASIIVRVAKACLSYRPVDKFLNTTSFSFCMMMYRMKTEAIVF